MSDTDPQTPEERTALRERNINALKRHSLDIALQLEKHVPATKLVFDDDGQPDVEFQGQKFYDGRYYDFVAQQQEFFEKAPSRFFVTTPQPSNLDFHGEEFLTASLKRATVEAKTEFITTPATLKSFFSVVLGIGLGGHMSWVAEKSDCKVMFVIEPNIENLYHSIELFDWATLLDDLVAKGGQVKFLISNDAVANFNNLRSYVRWMNSPGVDGMLLYQHYNNTMFTDVIRELNRQSALFLAGLGFFNDEYKMLENTHHNLSGGKAHIYTRQDKAIIPYPCLVVGCGPSLDADLKHIKALSDKAVVISSGSALGPLLNAGVTPDFQMEVENEGILPIMQHVSSQHDISDICLVTSSTIETDIINYFDRIIYHFRPALAPYGIFSDDPKNTIPFHDPSVVNSSLGLAIDMGFREIYFFGCDMGTRDSSQHHAKNSYHFSDGARLPDNNFCIKVPANFGGDTYTSFGLNWVKSNIERAMATSLAGRTYYNCSDGAFLDGAIAKLAKSIKLPDQENPDFKNDLVNKTLEQSLIMDRETFEKRWSRDKLLAATDECFQKLRDIFEEASFLDDKRFQIEVNKILFYGRTQLDRGVATWVRGTVQMILMAAEYYSNRIKNPETADEFEEILREELFNSLDTMHDRAKELINRLD